MTNEQRAMDEINLKSILGRDIAIGWSTDKLLYIDLGPGSCVAICGVELLKFMEWLRSAPPPSESEYSQTRDRMSTGCTHHGDEPIGQAGSTPAGRTESPPGEASDLDEYNPDYYACFTGDCPHDKASDCLLSVQTEAEVTFKALRQERQQVEVYRKRMAKAEAELQTLRAAGRTLLMVSLPPHDVSGSEMFNNAAAKFREEF